MLIGSANRSTAVRGATRLKGAEIAQFAGSIIESSPSRSNQFNVKIAIPSSHFGHHGTVSPMTNIASVLKSEITRIARKEIRAEVQGLKKSVSGYRSEVAALKRRSQSLEQELRRLDKSLPKQAPPATDESNKTARFSAKDLASQRKRLGLTIEGCALLLGTAGKSIYRWETGKANPREAYWPSIAALRTLSKQQAAETVAARK
jgi:DNA-binding transcriptional regulator YiaG